jgi:poly(A) polymerase
MSDLRKYAESVIRTLREAGYQAYLVGGCVRDLLLGREPADYDVTTDATPDEVMRIFPENYAVGAQFGVVLVPQSASVSSVVTGSDLNHGGHGVHRGENQATSTHAGCVEVATFRSDIGYSDGRHPDQVRFSKSPREDVERRDFTINGLLLDPLSSQSMSSQSMTSQSMTNQILDYVGGQKDLQAKIIRTIGRPELRFAEDKLRMLRAVRFAGRFGYTIDPATLAAIQSLASGI